MSRAFRHLTWAVAAVAVLALAACGASPDATPVGSSIALTDADGLLTASGYGPGSPAAAPGTGTCDGTGPGTGDGTCDGTGAGPGPAGGYGPGNGSGPGGTTAPVCCDPEDLETVLGVALQLEYQAQLTYERVIVDLGDLAPFTNIAPSEAMHVAALLHLFERRSWAAPASTWSLDNVSRYPSVAAACAAGVEIEIEDIALYDGYLARTDLPADAVNVFQNLRAASAERHLPAFQACQ